MSLWHNGPESEEVGGATQPNRVIDEQILDAARDRILAVGVRRTTLSDVARAAGISRPTLYRRWPDIRGLISDVMTREWLTEVRRVVPRDHAADRAELVDWMIACVSALRRSPLLRKILEVDPELLLPYLVDRRGTSHDHLLALLRGELERGARAGWLRAGEPAAMARAIMLTAQSFLFSGPTMTGRDGDPAIETLDDELRTLIEGYLRP